MTTHYKKFVRLIAKWPLDITKGERDLAQFIRERVKAVFEADKKVFDTEQCSRQYAALNRLADNHHLTRYPRKRDSTATGLSSDECNVILSSEVLDFLKEDSKGFISKIFSKSQNNK